jgi:hypothetical protein
MSFDPWAQHLADMAEHARNARPAYQCMCATRFLGCPVCSVNGDRQPANTQQPTWADLDNDKSND